MQNASNKYSHRRGKLPENAATALRTMAAMAAFSLPLSPSAGAAAAFDAVVAEILGGQTTGQISQMGPQQKAAMIGCVNAVLTGLPNGRKRYVMQGVNFEDRERRFGEVVQENRAEWKQKIARGCASIALSGSKDPVGSRTIPPNR